MESRREWLKKVPVSLAAGLAVGEIAHSIKSAQAQENAALATEQEASYIIFADSADGNKIKAKNGKTGKIDYFGTDASTVIQSAALALTSGRTWKEKVVLKGNFTISMPISVPSYSVLEVDGRLTLANGVNDPILKASSATDVEVVGGVLDGNEAGQTGDRNEGVIHLSLIHI